jgi:putative transposase
MAIKALADQHPISILCRVLNVNRSTYYKYINCQPSRREQENMRIRRIIAEHYAAADKRLGARKMKIVLMREDCISISEGRVYRLMKEMRLPKMSTVKPPKITYNKGSEGYCENLLAQRFDQPAPNRVWVCDFTYVKVNGRFQYVCAILDLFARKVIAWRVSTRIDRFLAIATLQDAVRTRGVSQGVMFHTDRGSQFTSAEFRRLLDELGMIQSFSAKGHPYDNAVMECFFKYLKKEELNRRCFASTEQLKQSLLVYIAGFYNSVRPHSHNHGLSPDQMECRFFS